MKKIIKSIFDFCNSTYGELIGYSLATIGITSRLIGLHVIAELVLPFAIIMFAVMIISEFKVMVKEFKSRKN